MISSFISSSSSTSQLTEIYLPLSQSRRLLVNHVKNPPHNPTSSFKPASHTSPFERLWCCVCGVTTAPAKKMRHQRTTLDQSTLCNARWTEYAKSPSVWWSLLICSARRQAAIFEVLYAIGAECVEFDQYLLRRTKHRSKHTQNGVWKVCL